MGIQRGDSIELRKQPATTHSAVVLPSIDGYGYVRPRPRFWKSTILTSGCLAAAIFIVNITLMAIASRVKTAPGSEGSGSLVLFTGQCKLAEKYNTAGHIMINALSTMLLGASNYGMQCLSAPTRREIDDAHAKGIWLHVGVLSPTNVLRIAWKRRVLWAILCLSSLPLHFVYNSVIFSGTRSNNYWVFGWATEMSAFAEALWTHGNYSAGLLTRMNVSECINSYAQGIQPVRRNVILVTRNDSLSSLPTPWYAEARILRSQNRGPGCEANPFGWICGSEELIPCNWGGNPQLACSHSLADIDIANWKPRGQKVDYCMVQSVDEACTLEYLPRLATVVAVFNGLKALVLLISWLVIIEKPFLTIGDAIESFIECRDLTTSGFCWLDRHNIAAWSTAVKAKEKAEARPISTTHVRWFSGTLKGMWSALYSLYFVMLSICAGFFALGASANPVPASTLIMNGFNKLDYRTFIRGWEVDSIIVSILVANTPQIILSFLYITYNGVFTTMLLASERNGYASHRKPLRVSQAPQGAQRSTYYLQLPVRYALPLMCLSGVLHWLCSESIYLVFINIEDKFLATCGFSLASILMILCIGICMLIIVTAFGCRRYANRMPIVGSCSAAISAACHLPLDVDRGQVTMEPLQWGEVVGSAVDKSGQVIAHCAFTSREVLSIQEDRKYG